MTHNVIRQLLMTAAVVATGLGSALAAPRADQKDVTTPPHAPRFTPERFRTHVRYLASDLLVGRQPGTMGIRMASDYIAKQFEAAGLVPAGENGTWFQEFEVQMGKEVDTDVAELTIDEMNRTWNIGEDWTPLPWSSTEDVEGPLAFAGFGIQADLHDYNDYRDFDAEGKVLLVFRYEPLAEDPDADFGGKSPSRYALFNVKARTAARQGAKALLIVNPSLRPGVQPGLYPFDNQFLDRTFDLPLVHITPEMAQAIVSQAGLPDLETLERRLQEERKPLSQDLGMQVSLRVGIGPKMVRTRNVIGRLDAAGDTDECIVIGAHYDHLGLAPLQFRRRTNQEYVHNGADDNATGTAAVIELARALGKEPGLRRDIVFMAFSAEEMGLLGSKYFVGEPTFPLDSVRAMINFDMIGRLSQNKFVIFGTSTATEFGPIVKAAAETRGLDYRAPAGASGNSDHAGFYYNDIPYLFAHTGVHNDYHRPSDDWELIDVNGAARVLDMFHEIVAKLANMEDGPTFQRVDMESRDEQAEQMKPAVEHIKEQDSDETETEPPMDVETQRPKRPKVRLGIIPDHTATDQPGVVIDTPLDGGAAQAAGLQRGDRIVQIGDRRIKDIYAYMETLGEMKPGHEVKIVVVRNDEEVTLTVKLQGGERPATEQ